MSPYSPVTVEEDILKVNVTSTEIGYLFESTIFCNVHISRLGAV